ncbi:hypothetical protein ACTHOQ_12205 [Solibacillus silvestris]|uniref:hypothetical protein n=1 Tax=Solibacillus silvestris TaxID=76853 RepID=UPI003F7D9FD5
MKTVYHCLIMWIPFAVFFSLATIGVELLEGDKIQTSEYIGLNDAPVFHFFIEAAFVIIVYPVSFFPLTFIASKYVRKPELKLFLFPLFGGFIGAVVFAIKYNNLFIEAYNLNIISSIILFGVAGLLFALCEIAVKKNIKFA